MTYSLLGKLLPAIAAKERAVRLVNAVQAMGAH
jgi:hypothetical protein